MLTGLAILLDLRYIDGCSGFVLLKVPVLGGLCINLLSFRIIKIGIFPVSKLLLIVRVHRLNSTFQYRVNICYRMRSVLFLRYLVFARVLYRVRIYSHPSLPCSTCFLRSVLDMVYWSASVLFV